MTQWDTLGLDRKIADILGGVYYHKPDHHFGRPFMTAYQLAIAFAERYPHDAQAMGLPVCGRGTGQHTSLPQYLAGQLSRRIQSGKTTTIEGDFLSNCHLRDVMFQGGIASSVTGSGFDLSMFRLRGAGDGRG